MIQIKDVKSIAGKWIKNAANATSDFIDGVKAPRADWATNTAAAEASYKEAVTEAANSGRFGAGVKKAGSAKWQTATLEKGAGRWSTGISAGQTAFEQGFAPFAAVISKLNLSPKYKRGDARNYVRSQEVGKALNTARLGAIAK